MNDLDLKVDKLETKVDKVQYELETKVSDIQNKIRILPLQMAGITYTELIGMATLYLNIMYKFNTY